MARTVKMELPSPGRYPWDEWFDGEVWELTPGEDFTSLKTIRSGIYEAAVARGCRVSTRQKDGFLYIQARPE